MTLTIFYDYLGQPKESLSMNHLIKHLLVFLLLLTTACQPTPTPKAMSTATATPPSIAGAKLPYVELEAEDAATNGMIIGPDRTFKTLAAEASGRRAVTLEATGQFVEFTLPQRANSIVIRYSIPDSADGVGMSAPLSLYIDDERQPDLTLTSKYSWVYGAYPFDNKPSGRNAHRFFDELHLLLKQMEPGSTVRLQKDENSSADSYTIDFADFEQVADPFAPPDGALSVIDYGADPAGATDSTAAIQKAVDAGAAQGKTVWLPAGTYTVGHILVGDNLTLRGAGMWHSSLRGYGAGIFGKNPASANVHLADFAIFGEDIIRIDSLPHEGLGGAMGGGSTIENIWIEHTKVGVWFNGPLDGATLTGLRIRNTFADGVNLHGAVSHVTFEQSNVRNTGDDGMAMWSDGAAGHDNVFKFNTVQLPNLANNIGIYGGYNISVTDNYLADTLWQGSGINFGNQYGAVALRGENLIARNRLVRAGSYDVNDGYGVGAIAFRAADSAMDAVIKVEDNWMADSSYSAIQFRGKEIGKIILSHNTAAGAGTFAVQVQAAGEAVFDRLDVSALGASAIYQCGTSFTVTGWGEAPYCGAWPTRVNTPLPTSTPCAESVCPSVTPLRPTRTPTPCPGVCPTATPIPPTLTSTTTATKTPLPGIAGGKLAFDNGHTLYFESKNVTDGNLNTYWEGKAYPNLLTIDLGAEHSVTAIKIKLNPDAIWSPRTQTLTVLGSTDNKTYTTLLDSAVYSFDPATGNQVTITFLSTTVRYVRLSFTANTGAPNGQVAEFEVYEEAPDH